MKRIDPNDLRVSTRVSWVALADLVEPWRQAHFAAQAAAELGKSWAEFQDDDSHSSFRWLSAEGWRGLEGVPAVGPQPLRARLRFEGLELSLVGEGGRAIDVLALPGWTLDEALGWIGDVAERELGARRQPASPAPDLPDHPLADGAPFRNVAGSPALAALYDLTARSLERLGVVAAAFAEARCWPHHFDLATLAMVAADEDGAMTRTIGVGVTPPDGIEPGGYWYVSPWSRDELEDVEYGALSAGRWVDRGGGAKMAVLPVGAFLAADDAAAVLARFIAESVNAVGEVMGV